MPALIRWPGVVQPGTVYTDLYAGEDWLPTFLAAAGDPNIKEQLLKGHKAGNATFKVHLDGYDQTQYLAGQGPSARRSSSTSPTTATCWPYAISTWSTS